jgi:hypothetical protein
MFTAVIVACHLVLPDKCMQITDIRGPYHTEERCIERVDEMVYELTALWTFYKTPMIFKLTSCVHPDQLDKSKVAI